jgi:AcrR family transcriptional regulator
MPRHAQHIESRILNAAASLAARQGPTAATVTAIRAAIRAPSGSIYHRFRSRDEILGRLWLAKAAFFQGRWAEALRQPDPRRAGLEAALSLPRAVREDFDGARIMLLYRREDFLSHAWPVAMQDEAERLKRQVKSALAGIMRRIFSGNTKEMRQVASFAMLDLPFAAVRRYVAVGEPPPASIDQLITTAYAAIIAAHAGELPPREGASDAMPRGRRR